MREIILDTETTGLDPKSGDRIVEIGCVEVFNKVATGNTFHQYINPERAMPMAAFNVHGLSEEFLRDYPTFAEIHQTFSDFIADAPLVIHNAEFDMRFINHEFKTINRPVIGMSQVIDTLKLARQKFPGAQASLDALCKRFGIDNSNRTLHGALLDAELLAEVYMELCGGNQPDLVGDEDDADAQALKVKVERVFRQPRPHKLAVTEEEAHKAFLDKISDPIWRNAS